MNRACYSIVRVTDEKVYLVDLSNVTGGRSVTNDVEFVVDKVNQEYPGHRVIYQDTDGRWDEIVHENGVFKNFQPYSESV